MADETQDSTGTGTFSRWVRVFLGLILVASGFAYESVIFRSNAPFQSFLVLSGLALIAWGLAFLVPNRWRPSRFRWFRRLYRERLSMPLEVIAYLAMMVILATGSMLGHSNTLLLVFSLMTGPFILNGWVVYAMLRKVRIEREVPTRVGAGETFSVRVTLHNERRFLSCRLMRVEDTIANAHEELAGRVLFFRVPSKQHRSAAYRVRLLQRGTYKLGPTMVSSRFPFALGERGRYFETPNEVLVHPQVGELSPNWWRRVIGEDRVTNDNRVSRGVFDDEFKQIREYRSGDSIRNIHWRTSARLNELMVREYQENREHDAVILLDLWADEKSTADAALHTELATSFAATVCHAFSQTSRDSNVAFFLTGSENVTIKGKASADLWNRILDALATCSAANTADPAWLGQQVSELRKDQLQPILITTRSASNEPDHRPTASADTIPSLGSSHRVVATTAGLSEIFRLPEDDPIPTRDLTTPSPAGVSS